MPTKGLSTLNPDSNWFSNRIAQCEFNANPMRINDHPHCIVWELNSRLHVDFKWPHLHTATMAPSSDLHFSQPSYCFSSWVDTWNTVCSPEKARLLSVVDTSMHAMPFLVLTHNCTIQINPDWANVHSVWTHSNRIRSGSMRIGCPVWTGL